MNRLTVCRAFLLALLLALCLTSVAMGQGEQTPTPTPETGYYVPLASGSSMEVSRVITYGDILVTCFILVLIAVEVIIHANQIFYMWFGRKH